MYGSNPVADDNAVYIINPEGNLLQFDLRTGEILGQVQFVKDQAGHLAIDAEAGLLYVLLKDSKQLIAFEIKDGVK